MAKLNVNEIYTIIAYENDGEENLYKDLTYIGKLESDYLFKISDGEFKKFGQIIVVPKYKTTTVGYLIKELSKFDSNKPVIIELDNGLGTYCFSLEGAPLEITENNGVVSVSPENQYVISQEY